MANSRKGNHRKAVQNTGPRGRRMYEWSSEVLHNVSAGLLILTILLVVATVLFSGNNKMQILMVSIAIAIFGVVEFIRVADNQGKGGRKKESILYAILGSVLLLAGILMAVFLVILKP